MKYIIMADGKGTRWGNYNGIPKHFIEIEGEPLIARTVRLVHEFDPGCEVIITSHRKEYEIKGARRYEPQNNILEIDRFTEELIEDNICFLYGDTFYSEDSIKTIVNTMTDDMVFFGNTNSIVAVKVKDSMLFKYHKERVRTLFVAGLIKRCVGWQVYQSYVGLPFDEKAVSSKFILLEDDTRDFNVPEDLGGSTE